MSGGVAIPPSWTAKPLGSFARTSTGGTPSRTVAANFGGAIPWVKSGELGDGIVRSTEETLTQSGLDSSSAKVFPSGTLCIALYGATVGKVGILDIDAATNQAVCGIFVPKDVDTQYLFYFLLSKRRALIEQGKGGAQSNISNAIVRDTIVPLAPFPEQLRIVAKIEELFSDLDAGVAALKRVRANLKRYRAAVLKAAVEGRLTEEWRKRNPVAPEDTAPKLLERILADRRAKWEQDQLRKFKEAGKTPSKGWKEKYEEPKAPQGVKACSLPASWCWATIDQCRSLLDYGTSAKTSADENGVAVLRMGNIETDGRLDLARLKFLPVKHDEFPALLLAAGDLLFNRTNSAELVGKSAVYRGTPSICSFASYLIRARFLPSVLPDIAAFNLISTYGRLWIKTVVNQTAGQANVNGSKLAAFQIALPPLAEQIEIVAEVDRHLSVADAAEQQVEHALQRAARLRQSILKRAFEGNLVDQIPDDTTDMALNSRPPKPTSHRSSGVGRHLV